MFGVLLSARHRGFVFEAKRYIVLIQTLSVFVHYDIAFFACPTPKHELFIASRNPEARRLVFAFRTVHRVWVNTQWPFSRPDAFRKFSGGNQIYY